MKVRFVFVSCLLTLILSGIAFAGPNVVEQEQNVYVNHDDSMFSLYSVQNIQYEIRGPLEKKLDEKIKVIIEHAVMTATEIINEEKASTGISLSNFGI